MFNHYKNAMRRLIFAIAMLAGMNFAAHAQSNDPASRAAALKTSLSLTDDQTAKVTAIYQAENVSMDSLKKTDKGDYGAMMKKMAPIILSSNDKIMLILKPEQAQIFKVKADAQAAYIKKMLEGGQR